MTAVDITQLILDDHHEQRRLFAIIEQIDRSDTESLSAVWGRLAAFLEVHAAAEEAIFYPELLKVGIAARRKAGVEGETLDAIHDHNEIRDAVAEAARHSVGSDDWYAAVAAANLANGDHMAEEEREGLTDFRRLAGLQRRQDLAVAFAAFEARNVMGVEPVDKDPAAYVSQAEAGALPASDGSLRIGDLARRHSTSQAKNAHCAYYPLGPVSDEVGAMEISLEDVRHALVELGRLRFGEMGVEEAIREIVETTHSMFAVDGAGLMLTDTAHHLRSVAASDDRFAHLEELQVRHQEGPCIEAYDTKELIGATDLEQDDRWPLFSKAAVNREVRAVLASPLPYNQDAVGVVAVLSERSRPWSPANELALLAFTDLAALLIASIIQGEQQSELAGQLQGALNSRQVIEQAKGVLMGTQGISARAAYEQLRSRARAERRKLPVVCAEVVQGAVRLP